MVAVNRSQRDQVASGRELASVDAEVPSDLRASLAVKSERHASDPDLLRSDDPLDDDSDAYGSVQRGGQQAHCRALEELDVRATREDDEYYADLIANPFGEPQVAVRTCRDSIYAAQWRNAGGRTR